MAVLLSCGLWIDCLLGLEGSRVKLSVLETVFLSDGDRSLYLYPSGHLFSTIGPLLHGLKPRKHPIINVIWCALNTNNRTGESLGNGESVTIQ